MERNGEKMTIAEQLSCLTDRPCDVCKFHTENGCDRWECVFEEEPDDCEYYEKERGDMTREEARAIMTLLKQSYINFRTKSDLRKKTVKENINAYDMAIKALEQEPKTGHWIDHQEDRWIYAKCSECETVHDTQTNYCPNCGARMQIEGVRI